MKLHEPSHIQRAEVVQLVILDCLFNLEQGHRFLFQGGTSLRWLADAPRFSEDLDFLVTLAPADIAGLLPRLARCAADALLLAGRRGEIQYSGPTIQGRLLRTMFSFQEPGRRGSTRVRLECYQVPSFDGLGATTSILGNVPAVAAFVQAQRVVRPTALVRHETPAGILADKAVALVQRPYLKGRDFWDVWFLRHTLQTRPDPDLTSAHCALYPPGNRRRPRYTPGAGGWPPESEIHRILEDDLARFIPPPALEWWRQRGWTAMTDSVRQLLEETAHVLDGR